MPNVILDAQHYYHQSEDNVKRARVPYDSTTEESVYDNNYQYSDLRGWLNTSFYDWAFDDTEKSVIKNTSISHGVSTVQSGSNNKYASSTKTSERIYLLPYAEYNSCLPSNNSRRTIETDYARCQGVYVDASGYSHYWTRSPYISSCAATFVNANGTFSNNHVTYNCGVMPSLNIKNSLIVIW